MKYFFTGIVFFVLTYICMYSLGYSAALIIPGTTEIENASIEVAVANDGSITSAKDFGFLILQILKIAVSGVALIYIVLIGAYMVIGSDSEDTVKTQRKQITYAIVAFLFLNIPSFAYTVFFLEANTSIATSADWSDINNGFFWNATGFGVIFDNIFAFLRIFIFGAAVLMFSWGFFTLILSGGDDEKKKKAKNRIVYGILSLIFAGFVGVWGRLVAVANFAVYIPEVGRQIFGVAMYFVAPLVIFMLMYGAYFMITSAGNEERVKKGKAILINTGIAVIILITALSFMTDLIKFQL